MKCSLRKKALRSAIALSATILFLGGFALTTAPAQELVVDGGFENPRKFESLWNPVNNWIACSSAEVTDDEAHSGNYSAKITAHDRSDCSFRWPSYVGIQQYINPTANTDYIMTFWILGDIPDRTDGEVEATPSTGGNDISLGIDSENNTPPISADNGEFIITPRTYSSWTKVEYYWNSGSGNSEFSIDIGSYTDEGGVYYLDDFSIVPAGTDTNIGTGLVANYKSGLWFYQNDEWTKLSDNNAEYMVHFDGKLAADFGSEGLQVWDGTSWKYLGKTANNGHNMLAYNGGLVVNYDSGLWFYKNDEWTKLSDNSSEYLTVFEGKLAADFDSEGLQVYEGTSWKRISEEPVTTFNSMIGID